MHRFSESIAAIATALAKAQIELSNPEKAMVGTVYNGHSESPQSFRYASLSSGLDIIRKALGDHQIAVTQTTDIDRAGGTLNLSTVLLHTSGEWISSHWPVCQLSETSAPRRMGAALTYARRYALFAIVGITGEDDLDASPDGNAAFNSPRSDPAPALAPQSHLQPRTAPGPEKLSVEESIAARGRLIQEIETMTWDNLQSTAIAILKAKNRMSPQDAKLVEDTFAARAAQQATSLENPPRHQLECVLPTPTVLRSSSDLVKKPRGRRKKGNGERSNAQPVVSGAVVDDSPAASAPFEAKTSPEKIDKSVLTISEPRRLRDKAHLKFVRTQACLICARSPADAHHLKFAQPRAMGLKVSDEFTVPLCRTHHRDIHSFGDEKAWWERRAIDPIATARSLWVSTRRIE